MTTEIVDRVLRSTRYRDVDRSLLARLATEELPRSRNVDDAVKRVKRRLHQAVGAYRGSLGGRDGAAAGVAAAWTGTWDDAVRLACRRALDRHASTAERLPDLDGFYAALWDAIGEVPGSLLDLACGLNPFALPFMRLRADATYLACDVDRRALDEVEALMTLVGQPHRTWTCDLLDGPPDVGADVALLLKTVPLLDRADPSAAGRVVAGLNVRHLVVSYPGRSLGGRSRGMERTYRSRMQALAREVGPRVGSVRDVPLRSELVFVLTLEPLRA